MEAFLAGREVRLLFSKTACSKALPGPEYTPEWLGVGVGRRLPVEPPLQDPVLYPALPQASYRLGTALDIYPFWSPHCPLLWTNTPGQAERVQAQVFIRISALPHSYLERPFLALQRLSFYTWKMA